MAKLHTQLLKDCDVIGRFELCHVLLMRDAHYPWCVLVPDVENIKEIFELSDKEQQQLNNESVCLAKNLHSIFLADKMNVAAIGNMVSQLHIHHVVRYKNDISWPKPVWGAHPALAYSEDAIGKIKEDIRLNLKNNCPGFTPLYA